MKFPLVVFLATLFALSCAEGEFTGGSGDSAKKSQNGTNGNCKPTPEKPCVGTGNPSTSGDPTGRSPLETSDGGQALLNRSFSSFYFSGNGPGSCANDPACGIGAPVCEPGTEDAGTGIVGDCPSSGLRANTCYGNRRICRGKGKLTSDRVATNFHFFVNQPCPVGWEGAGPIAGLDHHIVGYRVDGNWGYYAFCRQSIPLSQVVSKNTKLVTDILIVNPGFHQVQAPCPAGYQEAGVIADCVNSSTHPLASGETCKGAVSVCKKFELVP
jgi:hypothetical protein